MFTGIVREIGRVATAAGGSEGLALEVEAPRTAGSTAVGDSVSLSGCCLTAEAVEGGRLSFHAVPETVSRTTLGALSPGDHVNVEPALRAGDPLGGHYVQGHVDGVGRIESVEAEGDGLRVAVAAPEGVLRYCAEKGSITVDGVSLTIAGLGAAAFAVALVPQTLKGTTLSSLSPGQVVNLEVDLLAKYVERLLRVRGE